MPSSAVMSRLYVHARLTLQLQLCVHTLRQDTVAGVQRAFLGGKLEVTQTVPGGRWFLVPTPAFKVTPCDPRLCLNLPRPRASC